MAAASTDRRPSPAVRNSSISGTYSSQRNFVRSDTLDSRNEGEFDASATSRTPETMVDAGGASWARWQAPSSAPSATATDSSIASTTRWRTPRLKASSRLEELLVHAMVKRASTTTQPNLTRMRRRAWSRFRVSAANCRTAPNRREARRLTIRESKGERGARCHPAAAGAVSAVRARRRVPGRSHRRVARQESRRRAGLRAAEAHPRRAPPPLGGIRARQDEVQGQAPHRRPLEGEVRGTDSQWI